MKLLFILILHSTLYSTIKGLKCYTCSTTQNDIDQRCITNPESVQGSAITNCNKHYCTTTRVEYLDPKGKVQSMNRDCVDKPLFMNQIIEDSTFRIYYTSCQEDLCNGGSGKDIYSGSGLIYKDGADIVLYVKGIGHNNAAAVSFAPISIVSLIVLVCCYLN